MIKCEKYSASTIKSLDSFGRGAEMQLLTFNLLCVKHLHEAQYKKNVYSQKCVAPLASKNLSFNEQFLTCLKSNSQNKKGLP